jgi:hypothetical protein
MPRKNRRVRGICESCGDWTWVREGLFGRRHCSNCEMTDEEEHMADGPDCEDCWKEHLACRCGAGEG